MATLAVAYALLYAGLRTVTGSAALVATLLEPVTAAGLEGEDADVGVLPDGPTPL